MPKISFKNTTYNIHFPDIRLKIEGYLAAKNIDLSLGQLMLMLLHEYLQDIGKDVDDIRWEGEPGKRFKVVVKIGGNNEKEILHMQGCSRMFWRKRLYGKGSRRFYKQKAR